MNKRWWWPWGREVRSSEMTVDQLAERLAILRTTAAGIHVHPDNALQSPTMFAIVNGLSRIISTLPVGVYKREGADRVRQPDHPVTKVIAGSRVNVTHSKVEYWQLVMSQLLLWGNHYAKKQRAGGRLVGLQPFHPSQVQVIQREDFKREYLVTTSQGAQPYQQADIFHVMTMSTDGISGTSPVNQIKESIGFEIIAEKFGSQLFRGGAIPNVVIKRPGAFKDQEAFDRFKKSWNDAYNGSRRGTAVLEDGWDVELMQMNAEESQFLETRKLQRTVIAGAYGVPPHRIGDLERATFSNIEHQALGEVINTITPVLETVEAAANRDLLDPADRDDHYVKFKVDGLLRGDMKARSDSLKIWREWGVISANEWRALEELPQRTDPEGDTYLRPMNMTQGEIPPTARAQIRAALGLPAIMDPEDDNHAA